MIGSGSKDGRGTPTRWKDVCSIAAQDDAVLGPDIAAASRKPEGTGPYNMDAVFRKLNLVAQTTQLDISYLLTEVRVG